MKEFNSMILEMIDLMKLKVIQKNYYNKKENMNKTFKKIEIKFKIIKKEFNNYDLIFKFKMKLFYCSKYFTFFPFIQNFMIY